MITIYCILIIIIIFVIMTISCITYINFYTRVLEGKIILQLSLPQWRSYTTIGIEMVQQSLFLFWDLNKHILIYRKGFTLSISLFCSSSSEKKVVVPQRGKSFPRICSYHLHPTALKKSSIGLSSYHLSSL